MVVGKILSAEKHPEADKLQVCQVDVGGAAPLQIVCGAPNARAGLIAPLATIGTQVGSLTIKAAKLRGVESNGMLCSAKELGIDADASGLLELPGDAPVSYTHLDVYKRQASRKTMGIFFVPKGRSNPKCVTSTSKH